MVTSTSAGLPSQRRQTAQGGAAQRAPQAIADDGGIMSLLERRSGDRRRSGGQSSAERDLDTRALCHDLRQPLAAASLLAQLLGREVGLTSVGQERLEALQRELGRLAVLLTAHLEAPRTELVDLALLAQDALRRPDVGEDERLELRVHQAALVLGDPVLLARVLANLVANARAAAGRTGRVRITVGQRDEQVCVVVEDSAGTDEPSEGGHGLGLLIVDTVVARHGGAVQCAQSELGGLQVTVLLPGLGGWHASDRA